MTANTQEVGRMVINHVEPESGLQAPLYSSVKYSWYQADYEDW